MRIERSSLGRLSENKRARAIDKASGFQGKPVLSRANLRFGEANDLPAGILDGLVKGGKSLVRQYQVRSYLLRVLKPYNLSKSPGILAGINALASLAVKYPDPLLAATMLGDYIRQFHLNLSKEMLFLAQFAKTVAPPEQHSVEPLKRFFIAHKSLQEMGVYVGGSSVAVPLLESVQTILALGKTTQADYFQAVDKFQRFVRETLPAYKVGQSSQKYLLDPLYRQVLKAYVKQPTQPFNQFMEEALKRMTRLLDNMVDGDAVDMGKNLAELAPNAQTFLETLDQVADHLEEETLPPEVKRAYVMHVKKAKSLESIAVSYQLMSQVLAQGGDPMFLAKAFTQTKVTDAELLRELRNIGERFANLHSPQQKRLFEIGLQEILSHPHVRNGLGILEAVDHATALVEHLPLAVASMEDAASSKLAWGIVMQFMTNQFPPSQFPLFAQNIEAMMAGVQDSPEMAEAVMGLMLKEQRNRSTALDLTYSKHLKPVLQSYCEQSGASKTALPQIVEILGSMIDPNKSRANRLGPEELARLVERVTNRILELEATNAASGLADSIMYGVRVLHDAIPPELFESMVDLLLTVPTEVQHTADLMAYVARQLKLSSFKDLPGGRKEKYKAGYQFLAYAYQPQQLLNYFLMNRQAIAPEMVHGLYRYVDFQSDGKRLGKLILPEMMAMVRLHADTAFLKADRDTYLNKTSEAITRVYEYLQGTPIRKIQPIVLNNWSRIGETGLSFTKWQFDAMTRWKGLGQAQKPALMAQSGMFQQVPPRENDSRYHGGYAYYNPETGVSVEMRRAYSVISKPGAGTLVIRNSSHVFGRDLLDEPAYYHPTRLYTDENNLLNPDADLSAFQSVLSKKLNRTDNVQIENHTRIKDLLDTFDEVMQQYAVWKTGFVDGEPTQGFKEMLLASLTSTNPSQSPFGKLQNIKLAWIHRTGLPYAVKTFDVTDAANRQELANYVKILRNPGLIQGSDEYQRVIPNLLEFLRYGLNEHTGLELILTR